MSRSVMTKRVGHHREGSIALRFRGRDSLFNLGLQIANIKAGSGLHWRILDEARNILGNDLARNLESPHLVFEGIPIADRSALEALFRPTHSLKGILPQIGELWHIGIINCSDPALGLVDELILPVVNAHCAEFGLCKIPDLMSVRWATAG